MKRQIVPRPRNGGTWTEAKYWGHLRSAIRQAFRWWAPAKQALAAAKTGSLYLCAGCQRLYHRKQVEVDHVRPCGRLRSLEDLPGFVGRMTPEDPGAFQVLCESCHQAKTDADRAMSRNEPL
jgi:5-methylcytosine-specific restriction endonuclease McrA